MEPPPQLDHPWERLRWARLHRSPFEQIKDAAASLGIKPGTYRTYEYEPGVNNGRRPSISELQRICRRYGVNWVWVASGQGDPDSEPPPADERLTLVGVKLQEVPKDKQADAMTAMLGVLEAFTPRKLG